MKNSTHKQKHTATRQELYALHHQPTQKHTAKLLDRHALHHRSVRAVAKLQHLFFFLFIYRLQAQAHSGPGSLPRGSRLNLFFFYLYIDYKHKHAPRHGSNEAGPGLIFCFTSYIIWDIKKLESEGYIMEYKNLKKGNKILTKQLGTPISGELLESPKQGKGLKNIVLIFTNASEVGLFDESGSIYARDILKVKNGDIWENVTNAPE
jgi:hypothetical protein